MITEKIEELAKLQARTTELQTEIAREQTAALAALPAQYGFSNLKDFIKSLRAAAGKPGTRGKVKAPAKTGKRKRATITPEMKAKVAELAKAGKTGAEIAKTVGISLPSVQNIKKAAGLVAKRK